MWNELNTVEDLNHAIEESAQRAVLLFKHSTACPISSRALSEFRSYLADADPKVSYHVITVQTARSVSNEAAARLRIEHETPQAILVRNGQPVWNASHFGITAAALADAISKSQ